MDRLRKFFVLSTLLLSACGIKKDGLAEELTPEEKVSALQVTLPLETLRESLVLIARPEDSYTRAPITAEAYALQKRLVSNCRIDVKRTQIQSAAWFMDSITITADAARPSCPVSLVQNVSTQAQSGGYSTRIEFRLRVTRQNDPTFGSLKEAAWLGSGTINRQSGSVSEQVNGKVLATHLGMVKNYELSHQAQVSTNPNGSPGGKIRLAQVVELMTADAQLVQEQEFWGGKVYGKSNSFNGELATDSEFARLVGKARSSY